jgi:hypothetical protein
MKIIQPVLLATMISSAVFLLIGSAGTGRPDGDPGKMNLTYTYEGSAGIALAHAGQSAIYQKVPDHSAKNIPGIETVETKSAWTGAPENGTVETETALNRAAGTGAPGIRSVGTGQTTADPSATPGRHTTRSSSALSSYNAGTGYRGRPQNPLKYDKTMQNNSHQSRIVQFPMQPIDLTINPTVTPVNAFE